jgi:hypothetical protein
MLGLKMVRFDFTHLKNSFFLILCCQVKVKKFAKKLKTLRMQVRGSLYKKEISSSSVHEHDFGEETYDEDKDSYSKTCKTCSHTLQYEKMWKLNNEKKRSSDNGLEQGFSTLHHIRKYLGGSLMYIFFLKRPHFINCIKNFLIYLKRIVNVRTKKVWETLV